MMESQQSSRYTIDDAITIEALLPSNAVIDLFKPTALAQEQRKRILDYVTNLISKWDIRDAGPHVFSFGSVPLRTYLPDGDIDIGACLPPSYVQQFFTNVKNLLYRVSLASDEPYKVQGITFINAEVKIVKAFVGGVLVDISANTTGALATVCYFEEVDRQIGQNHLFKRSLLLIKAWCMYEARILASHHQLLATYALETLVLYVINHFHTTCNTPLMVLAKFVQLFALFPFEHHCITISGPVALATLLAQAAAATPSLTDSSTPSTPVAPSTPPLTGSNGAGASPTSIPAATPTTAIPPVEGSSSTAPAPLRIEGLEIKAEPKKSSTLHGPGSSAAEQVLQETQAALRKIEAGKADKPLLSEAFLKEVAERYKSSKPITSAPPTPTAAGGASSSASAPAYTPPRLFAPKYLNVMDPLDEYNNLGRSVNWSNYLRIRNALAHGHTVLSSLINDARAIIQDIHSLVPPAVFATAMAGVTPSAATLEREREQRTAVLSASSQPLTPNSAAVAAAAAMNGEPSGNAATPTYERSIRASVSRHGRQHLVPTPVASPTSASTATTPMASHDGTSSSTTSSAAASPASSPIQSTKPSLAAVVAASSSPRSLTKKEKAAALERAKQEEKERHEREIQLKMEAEKKRHDDIAKAHAIDKRRKLLLARFGVFFKNTLRRYAHKPRPDVKLRYSSSYKAKQKAAAATPPVSAASLMPPPTARVPLVIPVDGMTAPAVAFLAQQQQAAAAAAANFHLHPELYPPSVLTPDPSGFVNVNPSPLSSPVTASPRILGRHQPASAGAPATPTKPTGRNQSNNNTNNGASRSTPSSPAVHVHPNSRAAKKDLAASLAAATAAAAAAAAVNATPAPVTNGDVTTEPSLSIDASATTSPSIAPAPVTPSTPNVVTSPGGSRRRKKELSIQTNAAAVAAAANLAAATNAMVGVPPSPMAALSTPRTAPVTADSDPLLVEAVLGRAASAGAVPGLASPAIVLEHITPLPAATPTSSADILTGSGGGNNDAWDMTSPLPEYVARLGELQAQWKLIQEQQEHRTAQAALRANNSNNERSSSYSNNNNSHNNNGSRLRTQTNHRDHHDRDRSDRHHHRNDRSDRDNHNNNHSHDKRASPFAPSPRHVSNSGANNSANSNNSNSNSKDNNNSNASVATNSNAAAVAAATAAAAQAQAAHQAAAAAHHHQQQQHLHFNAFVTAAAAAASAQAAAAQAAVVANGGVVVPGMHNPLAPPPMHPFVMAQAAPPPTYGHVAAGMSDAAAAQYMMASMASLEMFPPVGTQPNTGSAVSVNNQSMVNHAAMVNMMAAMSSQQQQAANGASAMPSSSSLTTNSNGAHITSGAETTSVAAFLPGGGGPPTGSPWHGFTMANGRGMPKSFSQSVASNMPPPKPTSSPTSAAVVAAANAAAAVQAQAQAQAQAAAVANAAAAAQQTNGHTTPAAPTGRRNKKKAAAAALNGEGKTTPAPAPAPAPTPSPQSSPQKGGRNANGRDQPPPNPNQTGAGRVNGGRRNANNTNGNNTRNNSNNNNNNGGGNDRDRSDSLQGGEMGRADSVDHWRSGPPPTPPLPAHTPATAVPPMTVMTQPSSTEGPSTQPISSPQVIARSLLPPPLTIPGTRHGEEITTPTTPIPPSSLPSSTPTTPAASATATTPAPVPHLTKAQQRAAAAAAAAAAAQSDDSRPASSNGTKESGKKAAHGKKGKGNNNNNGNAAAAPVAAAGPSFSMAEFPPLQPLVPPSPPPTKRQPNQFISARTPRGGSPVLTASMAASSSTSSPALSSPVTPTTLVARGGGGGNTK